MLTVTKSESMRLSCYWIELYDLNIVSTLMLIAEAVLTFVTGDSVQIQYGMVLC